MEGRARRLRRGSERSSELHRGVRGAIAVGERVRGINGDRKVLGDRQELGLALTEREARSVYKYVQTASLPSTRLSVEEAAGAALQVALP